METNHENEENKLENEEKNKHGNDEENQPKSDEENQPENEEKNEEEKEQILSFDDVIISLRILSKLEKNDKICVDEKKNINIDNRHLFQGLRRWFSNDDRKITILSIKLLVDNTFRIISETFENEKLGKNNNDSPFEEENSNKIQKLCFELQSALLGLENLQHTYQEDIEVQSEIKLIIDKIRERVDNIHQILKIK